MQTIARRLASGVAVYVLCVTRALAAEPPIPLELFAAADEMRSPTLSPDGKHLAYLSQEGGKPVLVTYDFATKVSKLVLAGDGGTYTPSWCTFKNDERILCGFRGVDFDAGQPYGTSRLVAVNADGSQLKVLRQRDDAANAQYQDRVLHWLPDNPREVIIQLDDNQNVYPAVYKLDIYTGRLRTVQRDRTPVVSWMTDRSGAVRFGYGYRSSETSAIYLARAADDAPWNVLERFHRYDDVPFTPLAFGVRPDTLLVSAPNAGYAAIWEFELGESNGMQLVFAAPNADVDGAITWPWDQRLLGFSYETDRPHAFYIDDVARDVDTLARRLLPDRYSAIVGGSRDVQKVLVGAYSDVKPEHFYLLDLKANTFKSIGARNPDLEERALAPMRPISVPSGDVRIPGYLTVPVGKEPKNLPLVVFPHGGPYARDSWGYDPVVQMMASRGYAVLQLNFRGSTGLGTAWQAAGWRGWGGVIHEDITAGARWAVAQGIADPKRMCIVGWSYGGYAALLGAAREPELYKCAVSIAGVSDLNALKDQERLFYGGYVGARESIGADKKALKNDSPLQLAERIKVPVLLVHGDADYVVLSSHSTDMAKALRRHGVPTDLVIIKGGEHSLDREGMRLTLFKKLEAFLAANLGAAGP